MQKLVFTNGNGDSIDLTSAPYGITNWEGFSNAELNIQMQQVPFQDGGVYLDALINSRELSVTLAIQDNNNLSLRYEYRRNLISVLNPKLGEGVLVYTNDYLSKQIKVVPQIPLFENHNSNDSGTPKASLTFTACSPYWEDLEPIIVPLYIGQRFLVENVGDVVTGFELEFINDNVVDPKIINYTSNKSIEVKGTFDENILVNSNFGKKKIYEKPLTQKILNKTFVMNECVYIDDFGAYVGVSDDAIHYSSDTRTFKKVKSPSTNKLKSLTYNNINKTLYCFGEGIIISTTDLLNFTILSENDNKIYYGGCITSNGNLILVGQNENGTAFIQYDFNTIYTTSNTMILKSAIELNGKIIAVGGYNGAGTIIESSDLLNWTETSKPEELNVIAKSPDGTYVAIGGNNGYGLYLDNSSWLVSDIRDNYGEPSTVNIIKLVWIITDGFVIGGSFEGIGDNNEYVLGGAFTDVKTYNSDVFTSEKMTTFAYSPYMKVFDYLEDGLFLVFGNDGTILATYQINSYGRYISIGVDIKDVVCSVEGNMYVAISDHDVILIKDGVCEISYSDGNSKFNAITYSEKYKKYIIVGDVNIISSLNGEDWEVEEDIINEGELLDVTAYDDKVVAVGSFSSNLPLLYVYINGSWQYSTVAPAGITTFKKVEYSEENELFYISGETQGFISTNTGTNTDFDTHQIYVNEQALVTTINFIFCKDGNITLGTTDGLYVGTDGVNYTLYSDKVFNKFFYDKNLEVYIAYNTNDYIAYFSLDLKNWVSQETLDGVQSICSTKNQTIAVGNKGLILELFAELTTNIIDKITYNSDMSIELEIGTNEILITNVSGSMIAKIKYTPKYIGV